MNYPKTILEVQALEEEFSRCGLSPNDYLLITTQLKVDIHDNYNKPSKDFNEKVSASMQEIRRIAKRISPRLSIRKWNANI